MGMFERIGKIIGANINDIIRRAEDPIKAIQQHRDSLGECLPVIAQAATDAIKVENDLKAKVQALQKGIELNQNRAATAVQKGSDDQARIALTQKKKLEMDLAKLMPSYGAAKAHADVARKRLETINDKIEDAKQSDDMLIARAKSAKAEQRVSKVLSETSTFDPTAPIAGFEEQVRGMESEAAAATEVQGILSKQDKIEEQFREMESGPSVEEELAALKAGMNK